MCRRSCCIGLVAAMIVFSAASFPVNTVADCEHEFPICCPNFTFTAKDSVANCPAGDTLVFTRPAGHTIPSLVRLLVHYEDECGYPKSGLPPDSVWVVYYRGSGDVVVNDIGPELTGKIFADDSLDANGNGRITVRSFSGCGSMNFILYLSGTSVAERPVKIRTVDFNADGRTEDLDNLGTACDVNYDGSANAIDRIIVAHGTPDSVGHFGHWHRHALHGTLVRRTNLCDLCPVVLNNTIGGGDISWSANGNWLAFSARDSCDTCGFSPCRVKFVAADPARGNIVHNVTFNGAAGDSEDYDPSWSPLTASVYFVRKDVVIYRRGVPGLNPDTTLVRVIGDSVSRTYAQVSPDGDSLAFVQLVDGVFQVFVAPAAGGSGRQLTSGTGATYLYPKWSPDGSALVVTSQSTTTGKRSLYKIRVEGVRLLVGN